MVVDQGSAILGKFRIFTKNWVMTAIVTVVRMNAILSDLMYEFSLIRANVDLVFVFILCSEEPQIPDKCIGDSCKCPPGMTGVQPFCRPIKKGTTAK